MAKSRCLEQSALTGAASRSSSEHEEQRTETVLGQDFVVPEFSALF